MNSPWQPQRRPFFLVFINTPAPIDGGTVAQDKSCIYCTNTAPSGSTLTHSSVCVRTEGDPFQLLCVGVCQQCSWRQSPLWRPVFLIDTGPRSACSQGPTWGLMNNWEWILWGSVRFASLTVLVSNLSCSFTFKQTGNGGVTAAHVDGPATPFWSQTATVVFVCRTSQGMNGLLHWRWSWASLWM